MSDITIRHAETKCPQCGHRLDASSWFKGPTAPRPKVDDLTVCINCAAILTYTDEELHLRQMTVDEIENLPEENKRDISQYTLAVHLANRLRKTRN